MKHDWKVYTFLVIAFFAFRQFESDSLNDIEKSISQIERSDTNPNARENNVTHETSEKSKLSSRKNSPTQHRLPAQSTEAVWKEYADLKFNPRYDISPTKSAVEKFHYTPDLGEKISERNGWIIFEAKKVNSSTHPVVIDRSTKRAYPISHILHIKNADSGLKQELNNDGFKIYYHNERLKLLSVESSPEKVLETYENLIKSGLDVELEVLKELPQLK